ncbi:MAG: hypothetical protein V1830_04160 [Candidatus Omnitrophota bacterium]
MKLIIFFAIFLNCAISLAQDKVLEIYKDKNNYFTFSPPAGWVKEEIVSDTVSQVNFTSPDGKAGLGIIAQLNERELNDLFSQKKEYIKDYQRRFPRGKFSLSWATLGKYKIVKINFELLRVIKQEQYFFYDQGVRFDLVYGVANFADFEKYKQVALDAFVTVQRQKPIKNKRK